MAAGDVMTGHVAALVGGLHRAAPRPGLPLAQPGARAAGLRPAPGPRRARRPDPAGGEPGLGGIDRLGRSVQPGPAADDGAWFPASPVRAGRRHRGARARAARPGRAPQAAARVFRPRDRRPAAGRRRAGPARRAAPALLRHAVRADRLHRAADLRGAGADLRRCRPGRRHAHRPGRQTRPDPAGPAAPHRPAAAARLRRRAAAPLRPARERRCVLPHRPQRPDQLQRGQQHVHRAAPAAGLDSGRPHPHAARARPAAPHGGAAHPGLARPGRRRRQQDRGAGDLPRSRRGA